MSTTDEAATIAGVASAREHGSDRGDHAQLTKSHASLDASFSADSLLHSTNQAAVRRRSITGSSRASALAPPHEDTPKATAKRNDRGETGQTAGTDENGDGRNDNENVWLTQGRNRSRRRSPRPSRANDQRSREMASVYLAHPKANSSMRLTAEGQILNPERSRKAKETSRSKQRGPRAVQGSPQATREGSTPNPPTLLNQLEPVLNERLTARQEVPKHSLKPALLSSMSRPEEGEVNVDVMDSIPAFAGKPEAAITPPRGERRNHRSTDTNTICRGKSALVQDSSHGHSGKGIAEGSEVNGRNRSRLVASGSTALDTDHHQTSLGQSSQDTRPHSAEHLKALALQSRKSASPVAAPAMEEPLRTVPEQAGGTPSTSQANLAGERTPSVSVQRSSTHLDRHSLTASKTQHARTTQHFDTAVVNFNYPTTLMAPPVSHNEESVQNTHQQAATAVSSSREQQLHPSTLLAPELVSVTTVSNSSASSVPGRVSLGQPSPQKAPSKSRSSSLLGGPSSQSATGIVVAESTTLLRRHSVPSLHSHVTEAQLGTPQRQARPRSLNSAAVRHTTVLFPQLKPPHSSSSDISSGIDRGSEPSMPLEADGQHPNQQPQATSLKHRSPLPSGGRHLGNTVSVVTSHTSQSSSNGQYTANNVLQNTAGSVRSGQSYASVLLSGKSSFGTGCSHSPKQPVRNSGLPVQHCDDSGNMQSKPVLLTSSTQFSNRQQMFKQASAEEHGGLGANEERERRGHGDKSTMPTQAQQERGREHEESTPPAQPHAAHLPTPLASPGGAAGDLVSPVFSLPHCTPEQSRLVSVLLDLDREWPLQQFNSLKRDFLTTGSGETVFRAILQSSKKQKFYANGWVESLTESLQLENEVKDLLFAESWVEVVCAQFALRSLDVQQTQDKNCLVLACGQLINLNYCASLQQSFPPVYELIHCLVNQVVIPWSQLNPPMNKLEKSLVKVLIVLDTEADGLAHLSQVWKEAVLEARISFTCLLEKLCCHITGGTDQRLAMKRRETLLQPLRHLTKLANTGILYVLSLPPEKIRQLPLDHIKKLKAVIHFSLES